MGVERCGKGLKVGTSAGDLLANRLATTPCYGTPSVDHMAIVATLGMCAFGEESPRKYQLFRYEYMSNVHSLFPDAYWLTWDKEHRTRVRFEGKGSDVAEMNLGGHRGYAGIIPLTASGYAEYLLGRRSQFEFLSTKKFPEPAVCTQQMVRDGKMAAIFIQALFDMRRFPFVAGDASLKVRGFDDFNETELRPSEQLNSDIIVGRDGKTVTGPAAIKTLYAQLAPDEKFRKRLLCERLNGLFPEPTGGSHRATDPYRWARRAPVICFEATTKDGERFARHSVNFWRPMAISKDGNRIFGFNFAELQYSSRMNKDCVKHALEFCSEVLAPR
jgi:hypothetical protein